MKSALQSVALLAALLAASLGLAQAAECLNCDIEDSTDLENWNTVETNIIGGGGVVTRFYSTENLPKRYFRARRE